MLTYQMVISAFGQSADLVVRPLSGAAALFIDGLTSGSEIAEYILQPFSLLTGDPPERFSQCLDGTVYAAVAQEVTDLDAAVSRLVNGFCLLVFDGLGKAVAFEAKTGEKRSPGPPEVENTVKGPKDAFTETSRTNTSLLRRHLRSPDLQIWETQVGRPCRTNVSLIWLRGTTDPALVARMQKRLENLETQGLLTPADAEELITGSRKSPFPLLHYTERTDKFAAALLRGQVGLLIDGLPLGYLAPVDLAGFLTSPEDRGMDFVSASCVRVLRYGAMILSLLLPALYCAMAGFHQEMLPTKLLRAIIESKALVPFPTLFEVLGLLMAFEILQEAGIHLPQSLGQTVSIIGGLVVGTAAVEAKLISPAALIVVSAAGICGFAIPGRELANALRVWRFGLTLCAAVAGLFGMTLGLIALLVHLGGLSSFGRSYLRPFDRAETGGVILRRREGRTP